MRKINCNVINDMLPLYVDEVISNDTEDLIHEHLQNCPACQKI